MNRLPNYKNAFIAIEKLTEYCLNNFHPIGKHKAAVFNSALDLNFNDALLLKNQILEGLAINECIKTIGDAFGQRYNVEMKIRIFDKEALLVTAWIIRTIEDFPRLTTCFIKNKKR